MVDRAEYHAEGDCQLDCHIDERDFYVGHFQFVGHQLVGVLAVCLAEVFMQLYAVADGKD